MAKENGKTSAPRHALPARIAHWVNLIAMFTLILTGLDINYPFMGLMTGMLRNLHYFAGIALVINIVVRIYFAFVGKYADANQWTIPGPVEIFKVIRYYLFLGPHPVKQKKYNGVQRLSYLVIVILMLVQAVTGFAIGWPGGIWSGLVSWVGGLAAMRAIHLLGTYAFIAFSLIHVYMVFVEDPEEFPAMFWGKEGRQVSAEGKMVFVPESEVG